MGVKRAPKLLTDADIPAAIARDSETMAAINGHVAATDPHPTYLTQAEGDGRYRRSAVALTDADLPAGVARDSEVLAAINGHVAATDPHPGYLTQSEGDARYLTVRIKHLAGMTNSVKGQLAAIPHGLNVAKIVSFCGVIQIYSNTWLPFSNLGAPDQQINLEANATSFVVSDISTTWVNASNKPIKITVFYID